MIEVTENKMLALQKEVETGAVLLEFEPDRLNLI